MTLHKTYEVTSFKVLPDKDGVKGRFEAIVSVFGNVDYQGDRVVDGAFKGSIGRWQEKSDPLPVIWSHQWGDPFAHIGFIDPADMEEIVVPGKAGYKVGGLKVVGSIDLDTPFAAQVYRLMKERRVKEFSFGYDVIREKFAPDKANDLLELELIEVGPTLKGANPDTQLLEVKTLLDHAAIVEREAVLRGEIDAAPAIRVRALFEKGRDSGKLMGARGDLDYDPALIADLEIDDLMIALGTKAEDETEAASDGQKVYAPIEGSMEERQNLLSPAVHDWAAQAYPVEEGEYRWASVCATFDDHIVASVEIDGEVKYFEMTYELTDGGVTLGDPLEVEVEVSVSAAVTEAREAARIATEKNASNQSGGSFDEKALEEGEAQLGVWAEGTVELASMLAKAGRVLSSANESRIRAAADSLTTVLASLPEPVADDAKTVEDPEPEPEPETKIDDLEIASIKARLTLLEEE